MSERQKYGGAGKSGKAHFSAPIIFLPSFRWAGLPRHSRLVRRSRSGEVDAAKA